jgi:hypothetical protein
MPKNPLTLVSAKKVTKGLTHGKKVVSKQSNHEVRSLVHWECICKHYRQAYRTSPSAVIAFLALPYILAMQAWH